MSKKATTTTTTAAMHDDHGDAEDLSLLAAAEHAQKEAQEADLQDGTPESSAKASSRPRRKGKEPASKASTSKEVELSDSDESAGASPTICTHSCMFARMLNRSAWRNGGLDLSPLQIRMQLRAVPTPKMPRKRSAEDADGQR